MPKIYIYVLLAMIGACLGSFINVVALRTLSGDDWVRAPSTCFACPRRLGFGENLPIIGWFRRGGYCACGDRRIPVRYLGVELVLGGLLPLAFWQLNLAVFVSFLPFILMASVIFLTDLESFIIPDRVSLGGMVLGLVLATADAPGLPSLQQAVYGGVGGFALIYAINAVYKLLRKRDSMGFGDVKLMAMLGVWFGPMSLLPILFAASMAGAVFGIAIILLARTAQAYQPDHQSEWGADRAPIKIPMQVPFGCFLVPAAFGWLLFVPHALLA